MTTNVAELVEKALLLPVEEQCELVEAILAGNTFPAELIEEQMRLVEERMERIAQGRSVLIPADEAHQFVLDALKQAQRK
jgi:hypothetical protein